MPGKPARQQPKAVKQATTTAMNLSALHPRDSVLARSRIDWAENRIGRSLAVPIWPIAGLFASRVFVSARMVRIPNRKDGGGNRLDSDALRMSTGPQFDDNNDVPDASKPVMSSAITYSELADDTPVLRAVPLTPTAPKAWVSRLIEDEGPAIMRMLWRILGREADVLDAYQDCFCKLASLDQRCDIRSARAYAYRTAANVALEMLRTTKRRAAHWPSIVIARGRTSVEPSANDEERDLQLETLRHAITSLPDHLRKVVVLRDLARQSYEDVGRTLGIQPATARVYRRHAVVRLSEILGEEAKEGNDSH